jgi:hypothetical protein
MRVITKKPILVQGDYDYSNLDGKSSSSDVLSFQTFANTKGANLVLDGKWGPKTKAAYNSFGATWEASKSSTTAPATTTPGFRFDLFPTQEAVKKANIENISTQTGLPITPTSTTQPTPAGTSNLTINVSEEDKNKKRNRIILAVAGSVVLIGIIVLIAKSSRSNN